jgi:hypothetical protein
MFDIEKAKRKGKPYRRIRWHRVRIVAATIGLVLLIVYLVVFASVPACGCSPGFEPVRGHSTPMVVTDETVISQLWQAETAFVQLSTEIAVTNQAVAMQLTQTAFSQRSTELALTNQAAISTFVVQTEIAMTQAAPVATTCFHMWQEVADTHRAEQLTKHLLAAGISAQQVQVRQIIVGENWTCMQGDFEPSIKYGEAQTWVAITLNNAQQTDTTQLGDVVALLVQVLPSMSPNPAKHSIYVQVDRTTWQSTYADLSAALQAGTHGAALWRIGQ